MRLRGLVALAAAAAFILVPAGASSVSANPELLGSVGPSFSIRLTNPDGSLVTKVDPGTYDVVVRDLSGASTTSTSRGPASTSSHRSKRPGTSPGP